MARGNTLVPFGYEESRSDIKGTYLIIDGFDDWELADIKHILQVSEARSFAGTVFVPQHEATLKRMKQRCDNPFYARLNRLEEMVTNAADGTAGAIAIDQWEGKRKAYTPLDALLRFLTEKYAGPHFVYMNAACANVFAGTSEFAAWMKKLRMIVGAIPQTSLHPKLDQVANRWEADGFRGGK